MQNNEPLKLKKILNRESKSFLEKKEDEQNLKTFDDFYLKKINKKRIIEKFRLLIAKPKIL